MVIAAGAIIALAAWPHFISSRSSANALDPLARLTPAPLRHDELVRDKTIAFYEHAIGRNPGDQITPRLLAGEYLQRYREKGDVGDVLRARRMAAISLKAQPQGNGAGDVAMASALLTLHRFREARMYIGNAQSLDKGDPGPASYEASLDFELGDYAAGKKLLDGVPARFRSEPGYQTVHSRYDELTGHLFDARRELNRALREVDAVYDIPAERRAWYHFRAGELAFLAGDVDGAIAQEHTALKEFPNDAPAYNSLARFYASTHNWKAALDAAQKGAALVPLPETLGYEADAQAALGDTATAAQTRDEIFAIERIGNAYRISDRLLAVYYDDHGLRLHDAYAIARRELELRDDIYTKDTLAWAAAMDGRWDEAKRASTKAMAYGTEDSRLWYHAGMIAAHFGDTATEKQDLEKALALNGSFHPVYADRARATLASLK